MAAVFGGAAIGLEVVASVAVGVALSALAQYVVMKVYTPTQNDAATQAISSAAVIALTLIVGLPILSLVSVTPLAENIGASAMIAMSIQPLESYVLQELVSNL